VRRGAENHGACWLWALATTLRMAICRPGRLSQVTLDVLDVRAESQSWPPRDWLTHGDVGGQTTKAKLNRLSMLLVHKGASSVNRGQPLTPRHKEATAQRPIPANTDWAPTVMTDHAAIVLNVQWARSWALIKAVDDALKKNFPARSTRPRMSLRIVAARLGLPAWAESLAAAFRRRFRCFLTATQPADMHRVNKHFRFRNGSRQAGNCMHSVVTDTSRLPAVQFGNTITMTGRRPFSLGHARTGDLQQLRGGRHGPREPPQRPPALS